ncbi:non-ribosomal peptide synthetase, partial [Clostridium puniceum]|uniref:non-ribosomal peptide synthetase n=1 Tax=Clostridium puniceum TaxID=29367 RepID=UPI001178998E
MKNNNVDISELNIISEIEKNRIINEFNKTDAKYMKKTIQQLFEEQVEKIPNNIAVVFNGQRLTYKELNERANSLARVLREKGAEAEKIIGIMVDRSLEMIIGIIGILKAGSAYLPIDPEYPVERIKYMLEDSNTEILLTQKKLQKNIDYDGEIIDIEDPALYERTTSNLKMLSEVHNLAYIIYTSGTTGRPKGVLVEHIGIANLRELFEKKLHINEQDKVIQFASISFDASVWEINMSLLNGAELHILSKETIDNYENFSNYINVHNITVATIPPIYLGNVDEQKIKTLRLLITAGSIINKKILNKWCKKVDYMNAYGPTETTICATMWNYEEVQNLSSVPIGKPLNNLKTYVVDVDNRLNLMPIGKVGELCISGDSLARGYINRKELTVEKFVDNPFEPGTKMYRTGDLAKWLNDGNIEFVGRIDDQVKIRGFRIELGEIENQLLKIKGIKEAVVIDRSDMQGEKYLCAYITSEEAMEILSVRHELSKEIPAYMIPSYIFQIDKLPLTSNGKIDKKVLLELNIIETSHISFEAPRTKIEEILVNVWEAVLGIKGIGINHNYYQVGGDSIKSIQIISRLQNHNIHLLVKDLMEHPTISELSEHVIYKNFEIDQGTVEGDVKFAPIQKWFFDSNFSEENYWNQSFIFYKKDCIDEQILRKSFVEIMKHHDALRMIYEKDRGEVYQKNRGLEGIEDVFTLDLYDLVEDKKYEDSIEILSNEIQKGMDLEKGILLKLGLFKTPVGDYVIVAMHHIIVDGISWRILMEDLETAYGAIEKQEDVILPSKTTSYKEWNQKLIEYANSRKILKEIEYWNTIENTDIKEIPRDFEKSETLMGETKTITISLSKKETEKLLRKTSMAYNTQINDILLCSLGMAVKEWCGNEKVLINLEGHGREDIIEDVLIDRTIGWFTIMYPVVLDMTNTDDISYSIKYIKETLRRIPNKGIGYGILKYLTNNEIKDKITFKLEPEIIFNYLGEFAQRESTSLFKYSKLISDTSSISKANKKTHPIEINGLVIDDELKIEFNYSIKEYKEETINRLSKKYLEHLINIINHCEMKQETEKTPSDYGDNELTIEELEKILIVNQDIQKIHSLIPMQEGILYNLILDKNSRAYFEQSITELEGTLNIGILNKVFNHLIEKYEILRTAFFYRGMIKPKQVVLSKREITINYEDISSFDEEKKGEYIEEFKKEDINKGFDLTIDCLIRASVIKTSHNKYKVICSFHHIIMDGWCLGIIMKDITNMYKSLCAEKEAIIEKAPSYGKYLEWFDKQDKALALEYWRTYLEEYEQEIVLPKLNTMSNSFNNKEEVIFIENELIEKLKNIAKITNTTLNSVIQTAWGVLLQKYNNTDDVVFGSVVSGRANEVEGIEMMVGLFINTVPVRIKTDSRTEFKEVVKKINRDFIESNTYSYCSLAELQSLTSLKNKLINYIFVYENYPVSENLDSNKKEDLKIEDFKIFEYTNYDFGILIPPSDELNIKITYNGNVYSEEIIKSIKDNLYNLLNSVSLNPSVKLSELDMISVEEKNKLLNEFNKNKEISSEKTIQELFEEQAEKTPDNIAVVLDGQKLTYRELNEKSNSLGRALREKGVREEKIVGIIMDRSIEMI